MQLRRLEDRIHDLVERIVNVKDGDASELGRIVADLQQAHTQHTRRLRQKFCQYPIIDDRRAANK
jgi:hypothetical protein